MTEDEAVQIFCKETGGIKVGSEFRHVYPRVTWSFATVPSSKMESQHHTVVSLPTKNIQEMVKFLQEQTYPTDESYSIKWKKRLLYEIDPYFKSLCDQMNAYLHMFGDI